MSCPQPVGNPSFKYSSRPLRGGRRGGTDKSVPTGYQHCVLPDGKADIKGEADDTRQSGSNRSSVSSTGRASRSSSTSSYVRSHRTSVSQGPGGLMITVAPSSKSRKVSSLAVMREDDETSGELSATSSEANSRSSSRQQSSRTDDAFLPDLDLNISPPCVIVTDDDGTDIDEVSLPELEEALGVTYSMQKPVLETDV